MFESKHRAIDAISQTKAKAEIIRMPSYKRLRELIAPLKVFCNANSFHSLGKQLVRVILHVHQTHVHKPVRYK